VAPTIAPPQGLAPGHARLAPSAASRWLTCAASITLNDGVDVHDESGPEALAGSIIHAAFERAMRYGTGCFNDTELHVLDFDCGCSAASARRILDDALSMARIALALNGVDHLWLEQRVVPRIGRSDVWGTADVVGYASRRARLLVFDLKTGRWKVDVDHNDQCLVYALGALDLMHELRLPVREARLVIAQPSLGPRAMSSWAPTLDVLAQFRAFLIARAAATDAPAAEPNPSEETCRFCPARSRYPVHQAEV